MGKYGAEYTYKTLYSYNDGGYNWSVVAAYQRSDGAFAVVTDSGCSCNWYEEEYELENASWFYGVPELYREFDQAVDRNYDMSCAEKVEARSKLRSAV